MTIPNLKRIKVASKQELQTWLAQNTTYTQDVMIVTCNATSRDKHISSADLRNALCETGWIARQSYTLSGNLLGHVVSRA